MNNSGDNRKERKGRYLKTDKKRCNGVLGRNKGCGKK
jgi:hypothetical protein